jgi:hypothetical protein
MANRSPLNPLVHLELYNRTSNLFQKTLNHTKTTKYQTSSNGDVGAYLLQEIGPCWQKLSIDGQWSERIHSNHPIHLNLAYNNTELPITKKVQYGGVAVNIKDQATHWYQDSGNRTQVKTLQASDAGPRRAFRAKKSTINNLSQFTAYALLVKVLLQFMPNTNDILMGRRTNATPA